MKKKSKEKIVIDNLTISGNWKDLYEFIKNAKYRGKITINCISGRQEGKKWFEKWYKESCKKEGN